jgi:adenine-specific DNA-methyltransferase
MDDLFGRDNFIQSVVWNRKVSPANDAHYFSNDHDFLLFYAKSEQHLKLNKLPREAKHDKHFTNPDNDPRGPWNSLTFTGNKNRQERPNLYFGITNPRTGEEVFPPENLTWRYGPERAQQVIEDDRLYWGKDGTSNSPRLKSFLSDALPVIPRSVWGFDDAGHTQQAMLELQALKIGSFSSPKPEKLLKKIIQIGTSEGDIVMDFFSGSGTTPSTAQKMGRRWIAVEQMDYVLDVPGARLKKVIEGEQGGISKAVEWQGGGSFVYAELAASNSAFADRIETATDMATLHTIRADIQATGYLRYDVELSAFDTDDFAALPLNDAKRVLMDCLDTNHLYVNLGSLGDTGFNILDTDAAATRSFYGIKS